MKKALAAAVLALGLAATGLADDLYKINVRSNSDAAALRAIGVEPLVWVDGSYLVLADATALENIKTSTLEHELIFSGVTKSQLAFEGRLDRANADRFPVLYESEGVCLLLVPPDQWQAEEKTSGLNPVENEHLKIEYYPALLDAGKPPFPGYRRPAPVNRVRVDSLYSFVCSLQAYPYREAGTEVNRNARDWLYNKFGELRYDSVLLDTFYTSGVQCFNVLAFKPGVLYPQKQIIVGAHFDSDDDSPGADDNGSGVAGVLEMARLFRNMNLPVTIIFAAFDAEEWGKEGSEHYVSEAVANGDDIVFMMNMDMVGAINNETVASLFYGPEPAYAILWNEIASSEFGIDGVMSGTSTRSDHYPFQIAGYDVCFCIELNLSPVYHQPADSVAYMDFDYMTRMVKTTLTAVYNVAKAPPPVAITSIQDPNDGQSLIVNWELLDRLQIERYRLTYYATAAPQTQWTFELPSTESSLFVDGLMTGEEYTFYVQAFDYEGRTSYSYDLFYGTPTAELDPPWDIVALPLPGAIRLTWNYDENDLEFDHCTVIRDDMAIAEIVDTLYIDDDPWLGNDLHRYHIVAVDKQGFPTDTFGLAPALMKAATLDPGRILGVNRSTSHMLDWLDPLETSAFMHEALAIYDYDFIWDTMSTTDPGDTSHLDLFDMVDYGMVVIGAEGAYGDDIARTPEYGGILDSLVYYMSIGGKLVIFGRWGHRYNYTKWTNYLYTNSVTDDAYFHIFEINSRVSTPTVAPTLSSTIIGADLVGVFSQNANYPALVWDSVATVVHSDAGYYTVTDATGIPAATFIEFAFPPPDIIYTYDSRDDQPGLENQPVAWRNLEGDYRYVYFDIPLSFFERGPAIVALRRAIDDLLFDTGTTGLGPISAQGDLPHSVTLSQNYPNPFNPNTEIVFSLPKRAHVSLCVYNILGQQVTTLVDGEKPAGTYRVTWNGTDADGTQAATGIYFYRLTTGDRQISKKMLLLK